MYFVDRNGRRRPILSRRRIAPPSTPSSLTSEHSTNSMPTSGNETVDNETDVTEQNTIQTNSTPSSSAESVQTATEPLTNINVSGRSWSTIDVGLTISSSERSDPSILTPISQSFRTDSDFALRENEQNTRERNSAPQRHEENAQERNSAPQRHEDVFYRLLHRFSGYIHDAGAEEGSGLNARYLIPAVMLLLVKMCAENVKELILIVAAIPLFKKANDSVYEFERGQRYIQLAGPTLLVQLYICLCCYIYGPNSVATSLVFVSPLPDPPTFFSTLNSVILTDFIVRLITVQLKTLVALAPDVILPERRHRRRLYQWIEYSSQLYRHFLPVPRWGRFLWYAQNDQMAVQITNGSCVILYIVYKVVLARILVLRWLQSGGFLCGIPMVGSQPSEDDLLLFPQCTICYTDLINSDVKSGTKLKCGHVFCKQCISTWLDTETTCPICRAVVQHATSYWKTGITSCVPQLF